MENIKLIPKHTYLFKIRSSNNLSAGTILAITNTACYIKWNNGSNNTYIWYEKEYVDIYMSIIEDITEFDDVVNTKRVLNDAVTPIKYIPCRKCNGTGKILDDGSSTGDSVCNICWGAKITVIGGD